jgi:DNA adenine methylase
VIPYQGSKRKLASIILGVINFIDIDTLYEPFAGSAAITLAAASSNMAKHYVIGDKLDSLARLWEMIIYETDNLIEEYTKYWNEQQKDPIGYYYKIRDYYNKTQSPSALFYLIARCVKNSIRFNPSGEFNQSPDKRRLGMYPSKLREEAKKASLLLRNKTDVISGDFTKTLKKAKQSDLVYLDPPWKGLSDNPRYAHGLDYQALLDELKRMNSLEIPFILSFDGSCGAKDYEIEFPKELGLLRIPIDAGRSSQATLLGRSEITIESLYLSPVLRDKNQNKYNIKKGKENLKQLKLLG